MASAEDSRDGGGWKFDGSKPEEYQSWVKHWKLQHALVRKTDAEKTREVLRKLEGTAFDVATAELNLDNPATFFSTPEGVYAALSKVYALEIRQGKQQASGQLARLRQGSKDIVTHNTEFLALNARAGVAGEELIGIYRAGLSTGLAEAMAGSTYDSLASAMQYATAKAQFVRKTDFGKTSSGRFQNRTRGRAGGTEGRKKLADMTPEEKKEALKNVKCYNCSKTGHMARDCRQPRKTKGRKAEEEEEDSIDWELQEN
jgi:hypothetical protein